MTINVFNKEGKQLDDYYFNSDNINDITEDNLIKLFNAIYFEQFPFTFLYATKEELKEFNRVLYMWSVGLDDSDYFKFHIEPEFDEMPLNTIYVFDDGVCNTVSEHLARTKRMLKFYTDLSSRVQSPIKKTLPH